MQAPNYSSARRHRCPVCRQCGIATVEFALTVIVFLTLVFGVFEIARVVYLFNTLQEVTRRAAVMAANSRFDTGTISNIQKEALFPDADGNLILGYPVTPAHLRVDYLSIARDAGTGALTMQPASPMPSCPAKNHLTCVNDPYDASCIRLVRVRVCQPDTTDSCVSVPYKTLFPLVNFSLFKLPRSETIMPAQALGYTFGSIPCP